MAVSAELKSSHVRRTVINSPRNENNNHLIGYGEMCIFLEIVRLNIIIAHFFGKTHRKIERQIGTPAPTKNQVATKNAQSAKSQNVVSST